MKKYNLYAGLSGSFNNCEYRGTIECETIQEAEKYAYDLAVDVYESYAGYHGLLTWDEVAEENDLDINIDIEEINDLYNEELDTWCEFYAVPFDKDKDFDPNEYIEI